MVSIGDLPSQARFYYDLARQREEIISQCETALGMIATDRTGWLMSETISPPAPLEFRGAALASHNTFVLDKTTSELSFDVHLKNADGSFFALPQDEETQAEIAEAIIGPGGFFHGSNMTIEEAQDEYSPGQYVVVASPEGLPYIVHFLMRDSVAIDAANSKNATTLSSEECEALLGFMRQFSPDLREFEAEFECQQQ